MRVTWALDPEDPLAKGLYQWKRRVIRAVALVLVGVVLLVAVGVPHFQTTYRYRSLGRGTIPASERYKLSAWYFGPFGWHEVQRWEFDEGLPFIKLIPLHACIDFKQHESSFPFFLLPEEYRDGQ